MSQVTTRRQQDQCLTLGLMFREGFLFYLQFTTTKRKINDSLYILQGFQLCPKTVTGDQRGYRIQIRIDSPTCKQCRDLVHECACVIHLLPFISVIWFLSRDPLISNDLIISLFAAQSINENSILPPLLYPGRLGVPAPRPSSREERETANKVEQKLRIQSQFCERRGNSTRIPTYPRSLHLGFLKVVSLIYYEGCQLLIGVI